MTSSVRFGEPGGVQPRRFTNEFGVVRDALPSSLDDAEERVRQFVLHRLEDEATWTARRAATMAAEEAARAARAAAVGAKQQEARSVARRKRLERYAEVHARAVEEGESRTSAT